LTYDNSQAKIWKTPASLIDMDLIKHITGKSAVHYEFPNTVTVQASGRTTSIPRLKISDLAPFAFSAWTPKYYIEDKPNALYIRYRECIEDPKLTHKELADIIRDRLRNDHPKKIILDLRSNSGGSSQLFEHSIMEIKRYILIAPETEVYCLINSEVFSSGVIHTFDAKYILGAMLVGQPTAQGYNMYGELCYFSLPKSQFQIYYSSNYYEYQPGNHSRIVEPDIPIDPTIEDYKNGRDPILEYCLNN
jgi:C-terminal processing protease CtpA/Prc